MPKEEKIEISEKMKEFSNILELVKPLSYEQERSETFEIDSNEVISKVIGK